MSKTSEKYIIKRLEDAERSLKWTERQNKSMEEHIDALRKKIFTLVDLFEQTTSENGDYTWYRLKGSSLINSDSDAYKILDELLHPDEGIPF